MTGGPGNNSFDVSPLDVLENPAALNFSVYGKEAVRKAGGIVNRDFIVIRGKYLGNPQCACGFSPLEYCRDWGVPAEVDGTYHRLVRSTKMFSKKDTK